MFLEVIWSICVYCAHFVCYVKLFIFNFELSEKIDFYSYDIDDIFFLRPWIMKFVQYIK